MLRPSRSRGIHRQKDELLPTLFSPLNRSDFYALCFNESTGQHEVRQGGLSTKSEKNLEMWLTKNMFSRFWYSDHPTARFVSTCTFIKTRGRENLSGLGAKNKSVGQKFVILSVNPSTPGRP